MTVTPLHRPTAAPRSAYRTTRPRHRRSPPGRTAEAPDALTVSFEVTLAGEARYREALEIIDGLRQLTDRLPDGVGPRRRPAAPATRRLAGTGDASAGGPYRRTRPSRRRTGPAGAIRILPESRRVLLDGADRWR